MRKPTRIFGFLTLSDTNWPVQPLKKAISMKFRILEEEGLYYLCSENKGADHLCSAAPLFSHMQVVGFCNADTHIMADFDG